MTIGLDCIDKCEKPQDAGGCQGNYKRWNYDKQSMTCQQFTWGGCQGNENNFLSERECHLRCKDSGRSRGKSLVHSIITRITITHTHNTHKHDFTKIAIEKFTFIF